MTQPPADRYLGQVANSIVISRLLVLQSKRLMLATAHGRLARSGREETRDHVKRLEGEVRLAHERYNEGVLKWASPRSSQYQLVAYTSLIAKGERLIASLRSALNELPVNERGEALGEIDKLEMVIDGWRAIARASMSAAVA